MVRKIDISHKTIFFIAAFLFLIWVLYQILEVIVLLFVAIILMSGLSPIVSWLARYKIPRALAIAMTYILIVLIIAGLAAIVITPLAEQTTNLFTNLPRTLDRIIPPGVDKSVIQQQLSDIPRNLVSFTLTIFSNLVSLISVAVLTFYLLLERDRLDQLLTQVLLGREDRAKRVMANIEEKLGAWLRGQVLLSVIIAVMVYIVLVILNVPYALPLAILAGIMEVVPVIGPIISAIPAVFLASLISPFMALMVAGAFFVIQQAENHVIVPQVMKKAVGLNPLVIILAVAAGGKLLGITGALLAVPIAVVIQLIADEMLTEK